MNSIYKYFLLLCVTWSMFNSCKKYPEDPGRPFETATHRLIEFGWVLKEYNVDGVDSSYHTYNFSGNTFYALYGSAVKFSKSGNLVFHENILEARVNGVSLDNSTWKFEEHKKQLTFSPSGICQSCSETIHYFPVEPGIWTIRTLTKKELILETTNIQSKTIRVKFTH